MREKMKNLITFLFISLMLFTFSCPLPAADSDKGKRLFDDPRLGNGNTGKTCRTCHEGGLDLDSGFSARKNFEVMGVKVADAVEAVNFCIEVTLRGEGLDSQSREMANLLAYLEVLAKEGGGRKYDP